MEKSGLSKEILNCVIGNKSSSKAHPIPKQGAHGEAFSERERQRHHGSPSS